MTLLNWILRIAMTKYTFRFNLDGGDFVDLKLDKKKFESLSKFCEQEFPDKNWKTKKVKVIEASRI